MPILLIVAESLSKPLINPEPENENMTRKDYQLIADTIGRFTRAAQIVERSSGPASLEATIEGLVGEFVASLVDTNPRFDAKRFIDACNEGRA